VAKLAVAQVAVDRLDAAGNLARCVLAQEEAAAAGATLVVLPEAALTGYVFDDLPSANRAAVRADGRELAALSAAAAKVGVTTVVGFLEAHGSRVRNAAAVLTPDGGVAVYRKTHQLYLGADRFADAGDTIGPVVETPAGRVGVAICYDIRFPEMIRCLALAGADIVALPASFPTSARILAEQFPSVRAAENRVYLAVANRGDREGGIEFYGGSEIVAPSGDVLARCNRGDEPMELAIAEVDLDQARRKATVFAPGVYEIDILRDRRPELYQPIVERTVTSREQQLAAAAGQRGAEE
jgi:predicted amidohydrolase